jgi:hypothetical protein
VARYRVIYRFRRRTNHHDAPTLSVNYSFLKLVGAGLKDVLVPIETMFSIAHFVRPILRPGSTPILFPEAHCVPTLGDSPLVPVHQALMHRMDLRGYPYEISNLRISVPPSQRSMIAPWLLNPIRAT